MKFKKWLTERIANETSTSTADVANFSRPLGSDVQKRKWPPAVALRDSGFTYKVVK